MIWAVSFFALGLLSVSVGNVRNENKYLQNQNQYWVSIAFRFGLPIFHPFTVTQNPRYCHHFCLMHLNGHPKKSWILRVLESFVFAQKARHLDSPVEIVDSSTMFPWIFHHTIVLTKSHHWINPTSHQGTILIWPSAIRSVSYRFSAEQLHNCTALSLTTQGLCQPFRYLYQHWHLAFFVCFYQDLSTSINYQIKRPLFFVESIKGYY